LKEVFQNDDFREFLEVYLEFSKEDVWNITYRKKNA